MEQVKVFLDTDIVIDYYTGRMGDGVAEKGMQVGEHPQYQLCISVLTGVNAIYVLSKFSNIVSLSTLLRHFEILPMLKGEKAPDDWRHRIYYEYYWEYAFPQTPTMFGVRTDDYKYIHYHGIWDTNEFYDIKNDPDELHNLIDDPKYQDIIKGLDEDLYNWLETTGGMEIPLKRNTRKHNDWRNGKVF